MNKRQKFRNLWILETDTVVGIGAPISDENLELLFHIKKRPFSKKIIILVGSIEQAQQFVAWNKEATQWAIENWPGAKSIIVNNQGFRMPDCKKLCSFLLDKGPMYVTSANISGNDVLSFEQAKIHFDQIVNYFDCCQGSKKPSSIYDLDLKIYYR